MYGKRKAAGLLLCVWLTLGLAAPANAAEPAVSAQAAVVMNAADGSVLWGKHAHQRLPMASTTKIMTALLTLEAAAVEDRVVTITQPMVTVEGTSMGLQVGDKVPLHALAGGMLAASGNDAANAAAFALAGSQEAFAAQMNARAASLHLRDTHFVTPSGLDDAAHYSTAADMALLGRAAMQNLQFAAIARERTVKARFADPAVTRSYRNHNRLLSLYEGCIGVKTGFTKKAGRCLVSCAERAGVRLVAVTLHAPDDWRDHAALLDYGFSQLKSVTPDDSAFTAQVPAAGAGQAPLTVRGERATEPVVLPAGKELTRRVELPRFAYLPMEAGSAVGRVCYLLDGKEVAATRLLAA